MLPRLSGLALPFGAGIVLSFGQEPFHWPVVVLPALAILIWAISRATDARRGGACAFAAGFGYFLPTLSWIINPFLVEPELYAWMAPFAAGLLPAGLAIIWAVFVWAAMKWSRSVAGVTLGLMAAEVFRAYALTGFPWAQVSHAMLDTVTMSLFAYVGAMGLTLIMLGVAGVAAYSARWWMVCILTLSAVPYAPEPSAMTQSTVRLVQPNASQADKWVPEKAEEFYQRMLSASMAMPAPDLIVWPETAIPTLMNYAEYTLAEISAATPTSTVILGLNRSHEGLYFNSMLALKSDGTRSVYDKSHLVPFGEYFPGGELAWKLGLRGFSARDGAAYAAGPGPEVIDIPGVGPILPLICYEGIFPSMSASGVRPAALVLITNDAWFGPAAGPKQHFAQARIRAIEQGVPMVRVGNTGISAVIDGYGTIVADVPFQTIGYVDTALPITLPTTFYAQMGRFLGFIVILAALCAVLITNRSNGR